MMFTEIILITNYKTKVVFFVLETLKAMSHVYCDLNKICLIHSWLSLMMCFKSLIDKGEPKAVPILA